MHRIRQLKLIFPIGLALAAIVGISNLVSTSEKPVPRNGGEAATRSRSGGMAAHPVAGNKDKVGVAATPVSQAIITPDSAKKRLLEYRSIPNVDSRVKLMGDVIRELCRAGYTDAAWNLIDDQAGVVREVQLNAFFYETKLSQTETLKLISDLINGGYRGEQATALSAYVARFSPEELKNLIGSDDFKKLSKEINKDAPAKLRNEMEGYFIDELSKTGIGADKQLEMLQLAESFYAEDLIGNEHLYRILDLGRSVDAFERWRILHETIKNSDDFENFNRKRLVQQLVQTDVHKAVNLMLESDGKSAISDLSTVVQDWVTLDPVEAGKWFQSNQGRLTAGNRDTAAAAFASSAIDYGERGSASQWIDYITDPQLKQDMAEKFKNRFPDK